MAAYHDQPRPGWGFVLAHLAEGVIECAACWAILQGQGDWPPPALLVLLTAALVLVFAQRMADGLYRAYSTEYALGEDALLLRAGFRRKRVPLGNIIFVRAVGFSAGGRSANRYANRLARRLELELRNGDVARLTPTDPERFLTELIARAGDITILPA